MESKKSQNWIMKKKDDGSYCYIKKFNGVWAECGFQIPKWEKNGANCMYLKYAGKYIKNKMLYEEIADINDALSHKHLHSVADAVLDKYLETFKDEKKTDIPLKPLKKIEETTEFNILDN